MSVCTTFKEVFVIQRSYQDENTLVFCIEVTYLSDVNSEKIRNAKLVQTLEIIVDFMKRMRNCVLWCNLKPDSEMKESKSMSIPVNILFSLIQNGRKDAWTYLTNITNLFIS